MSFDSSDPHRWSHALSQALRAIRKARGLRTQDVADRMNLPLRTYEHFESGRGKVNMDRIYAFAVATESDPFALIAAMLIQAPSLAARSSRNKLVLTLAISLHDFNTETGDDIDLLETGQLLTAFSQMFSGLAEEARRRRQSIDDLERRIKGWRQGPPTPPVDGDDKGGGGGDDDGGSGGDPSLGGAPPSGPTPQ